MQIYKIYKFYGNGFQKIFRFISFDNESDLSDGGMWRKSLNQRKTIQKFIFEDIIIHVIEHQIKTIMIL